MAPLSTSSIALPIAGKTASVDIPKPRDGGFWEGRESFAAVAARSLPGNKKQHVGLPTPPNSISPTLPPQGFKARVAQAPPTPPAAVHGDSDIDLQDAVDHANSQDQPQHGLGGSNGLDGLADLDAAGAITSGLLAKHHLPGILIDNGPLAIRHVMGYLTTSVPGFSGIPPAKARRLVVGALEGRGSGGEQGGMNGDVIFEKVGWGRWDARRRGQLPREARPVHADHNLRPAGQTSPSSAEGLHIPRHSTRLERNRKIASGTSMAGESAMYSHDSEMEYDHPVDDISMLEHEADKMSLDGQDSCSSPEPPDDSPILDYDADDVTDEEDWASIGAVALRQGSFPRASAGGRVRSSHPYARHVDPKARGRGGGPPLSMLAKSVPMSNSPGFYHSRKRPAAGGDPAPGLPRLPEGEYGSNDLQEREAIEALVQLSSV
ncbi:DNA-binding proteins Bright/BRCAA1/RBP1 and proteins containing BRIGHT domain [Pseudocyphellaria aurata]|nr:DNA-binding proteins Bright/BRCAA1/RBP1 and proteins containing BRIGHT domain [Pseudocyphellaria aurata]